jgi:hypothetical protein
MDAAAGEIFSSVVPGRFGGLAKPIIVIVQSLRMKNPWHG